MLQPARQYRGASAIAASHAWRTRFFCESSERTGAVDDSRQSRLRVRSTAISSARRFWIRVFPTADSQSRLSADGQRKATGSGSPKSSPVCCLRLLV